ncbi:MAG TPA: phosphatase PAP2 family protein [Candidatus Thermoplasmatota archaeon]|nr:phosphatase PAP2 family protein [Candidatus Thermoplasmatota archaeon]
MGAGEVILRALKASALNPDLLYFAMGGVAIGGVLLATVVARHKGSPDSWFTRYATRLRSTVPALLVMSGVIFVVGLQGNFERMVQAWHGWDFTWMAYAIEGNAAERFQDFFRRPWLDGPVVAIYSAGAFLLYQVPFLCLVFLGRGRSAMRVACTLGLVWAVGIVCYFFVPVYEVWVTASPPYGWTHVTNVYFEVVPEARGSYNYMTAINNNFPSLHVGATSAIALSLLLARERWLGVPAALVAAGVAFATVYLGIHWFVDVAAGFLTAGAAAWLVHRKLPAEETAVRLPLTPGAAPGPSAPAEEAR